MTQACWGESRRRRLARAARYALGPRDTAWSLARRDDYPWTHVQLAPSLRAGRTMNPLLVAGCRCYSRRMRPLLLAVLLLSCAGDESRRGPAPAPTPAPASARATAPPTQPTAATRVAVADGPKPAAQPAPDPLATTRQAAHDVLAQHCGECHEGHRSTTPKALAVFDLDQPAWPSRFDAHRFESALGRLSKKPEPASATFIAFRDAELAARTQTN
jgi:mono/diheme cytochrome c family protein